MRKILAFLSKWLVRFIPVVGYVESVEAENARLKLENQALLSKILEITTGSGLTFPRSVGGVGAAPAEVSPSVEAEPVTIKTQQDVLRELEQKSKDAFMSKIGEIKSSREYEEYIRTGKLPSFKDYEAQITGASATPSATPTN